MPLRLTDLTKRLFCRPPGNRLRTLFDVAMLEDRTVPTAVVTVAGFSDATEGGAAGVFRLNRTETSGELTVQVSFAGTATAGSDYVTPPSTVTFADGAATADVTLPAIDDSLAESTETITLSVLPHLITGGGGNNENSFTFGLNGGDIGPPIGDDTYAVGEPDTATINLYDNDSSPPPPPPPPTVTVANLTDTIEGGTPGAFRFTRTGNTSQSLTVTYTVDGAAAPGSDYTALSGTVTFAANSATADVNVAPIDDSIAEYDETVYVSLQAGSGYTIGDFGSATVIIADNEQPVVMVEEIANAVEGADSGWFAFSRMGNKSQALTVNFTVGGTATSGTDYSSLGTSITIPAGEFIAYKEIAALADGIYDPDEIVIVTIAAGTGYTIDTADVGTVQIQDGTPVVTVAKIADAFEAGEVEGKFQFSRTGSLEQALTVTYTVSGTATPGTDYVPLTGSVVFPASAATVDAIVTPIDDNVVDPGEKVIVTIQAGAGYLVDAMASASVKIVDDEVPVVRVRKVKDAAEGVPGNAGTFLFERDGDTSNALVISYLVSGSASGTQYTGLSGTLTFPANVAAVAVDVTPASDSAAEGTQTIVVEVVPGANYESDSAATDVMYLSDDDGAAGEIGGVLWSDGDGDGIREPGEPLLAGQAVNLLDANGALLLQTVTDANGFYHFVGLDAGTYSVQAYAPLLSWYTSQDQGANEATDSDLDPTTGQSDPITLTALAMSNLLVGGGFTSSAPPDPPGQVVTIKITKADGTTVGDEGLKVAKWSDAFELDPATAALPVARQKNRIKGPNANGWDFIDRDPDRFNVYVYDLQKWQANVGGVPSNPYITLDLSTSNAAGYGAYDDAATTISLTRLANAGWYMSDSQILVSNATDDKYDDANVGKDEAGPLAGKVNEKNGYKYEVSDRTHMIALDGNLKAKYGTLEATSKVKVEKVVKLYVNILKDAAGAGGQPVTTKLSVEDDLRKMREIYAQIGIRVDAIINDAVNPTAGVNLMDGLDPRSTWTDINRNGTTDKQIAMSQEQRSLAGDLALQAKDPANAMKKDLSFVHVYYVGKFTDRPLLYGTSVPGNTVAGADFGDVIFLGSNRRSIDLAHEVFHVLEDRSVSKASYDANIDTVHYPYFRPGDTYKREDSTNLMVPGFGSVIGEKELDSVRLLDFQQTRAYLRTTLLKNP